MSRRARAPRLGATAGDDRTDPATEQRFSGAIYTGMDLVEKWFHAR